MAASCSDALVRIKSGASSWVTYYNRAMDHHSDAQAHWNLGEDHEAIEDLLLEIYDVRSMGEMWGGWSPYDYEGPIWWWLTNCSGGDELTMDSLINVMLQATNEEYKAFIGLVDAFRMALWNQPFEAEYYSALARGFTQ